MGAAEVGVGVVEGLVMCIDSSSRSMQAGIAQYVRVEKLAGQFARAVNAGAIVDLDAFRHKRRPFIA